jgi:hypothetical protein
MIVKQTDSEFNQGDEVGRHSIIRGLYPYLANKQR